MFLLFGFAPWVLGIELALFIAFVVLVDLEYYGWSTLMCVVSLLSIHFLMKINIIEYIKTNPTTILMLFGVYLAAGITWSFIKWISFLYRFKEYREEKLEEFRARKAREAKRQEDRDAEKASRFARQNEIRIQNGQPPFVKEEPLKSACGGPNYYGLGHVEPEETEYKHLQNCSFKNTNDLSKAPSYKDYKGKIVAWVVFWIPSLIGTLLDDFVRKLVTWIVNRFSAIYQALSHKIVGNFPEPPKKASDA
jgi:hypothetical protein